MFSLGHPRPIDPRIIAEALRWMDEMRDLRRLSPIKSREFIVWMLGNRQHLAEILRLHWIRAKVWRERGAIECEVSDDAPQTRPLLP